MRQKMEPSPTPEKTSKEKGHPPGADTTLPSSSSDPPMELGTTSWPTSKGPYGSLRVRMSMRARLSVTSLLKSITSIGRFVRDVFLRLVSRMWK